MVPPVGGCDGATWRGRGGGVSGIGSCGAGNVSCGIGGAVAARGIQSANVGRIGAPCAARPASRATPFACSARCSPNATVMAAEMRRAQCTTYEPRTLDVE